MTWRIPIARPDLPPLEEYMISVADIWRSRQLSNFGPFVECLEKIASDHLGVPCVAVASGDIGLICAVAALRLPPLSKVLVPSFTFQSTINAIVWNGHVPVFCDIHEDSLLMDIGTARWPAAAAVVTETFGVRYNTFKLPASLPVVVDAAHAYGSSRPKDGAPRVYSLSGTKVVTSAEGGIVASNDAEFLERVRLMRGYGFSGDYDARAVGINGKMSELHAALGCLTLPRVEAAVSRRNEIAMRYVVGLGLSVNPDMQWTSGGSAYKDFVVLFETGAEREMAERALTEAGIQTKRYFRPLHEQEAYKRFWTHHLPVTENVYWRSLCLPIFGSMTDAQVDEVCAVIIGAVR